MVKAILFDLDGTLLDTLPDLNSSMNAMLAHFGFPVSMQDTRFSWARRPRVYGDVAARKRTAQAGRVLCLLRRSARALGQRAHENV
ncbi:MAG: HAD hydrolase-like protein [Candidatus Borkfalkia sp.]